MSFDKLTVQFTPEEVKKVQKALEEVEKILEPRTINLTPQEKKKMTGPGKKSQIWRNPILIYLDHFPELTPSFMNVEEYRSDIKALEVLTGINAKLIMIKEMVNDTSAQLRSDIYQQADCYRENVLNAAKRNVPGSTSVAREIKKLFSTKGKKGRKKKV